MNSPHERLEPVRSQPNSLYFGVSVRDDDHARRISGSGSGIGSGNGVVVTILGAEQRAVAAYGAICERLHTASLRTVVIGPDPRLTAKSVMGILDVLSIGWAVVVGDRAGGELAWELAATRLGRFAGLVAIDRGIRAWQMSTVRSATTTARRWRSAPPCW
ncbi:hypothetical protein BZL30_0500 [Mycobacterium kansasii]|uniref:Uncharacterized protein n=1 Tax=Mycobacterium kansasii TaxID=1768 RepID=A0A1V3XVJ6_MYCKA|nr:hypothetical protein BZL30_0500 [Mycobacterium kansasii]